MDQLLHGRLSACAERTGHRKGREMSWQQVISGSSELSEGLTKSIEHAAEPAALASSEPTQG